MWVHICDDYSLRLYTGMASCISRRIKLVGILHNSSCFIEYWIEKASGKYKNIDSLALCMQTYVLQFVANSTMNIHLSMVPSWYGWIVQPPII